MGKTILMVSQSVHFIKKKLQKEEKYIHETRKYLNDQKNFNHEFTETVLGLLILE